jgi:hypothetical protein
MKFLSLLIISAVASLSSSQRVPFDPRNFKIPAIIQLCPTCSFSGSYPFGSSTGTSENCGCLFEPESYRIILRETPQRSCCSATCPKCPSYSTTACTCVRPFNLGQVYSRGLVVGYCCDIPVGIIAPPPLSVAEATQVLTMSPTSQKKKKCHKIKDDE